MEIDNRYLIYEGLQNATETEQQWASLLMTYGSQLVFKSIRDYSKCVMLAIMKYRRVLRESCVGNVSLLELESAYKNKDIKELHKLLEYMFLEPISNENFKFIIDRIYRIDKIGSGIERLYKRHLEDKNLRILSLIITL